MAVATKSNYRQVTDKQTFLREELVVATAHTTAGQFPVRVLGGPTALFEYGGLKFLTDPTFDAPGDYYAAGQKILTKNRSPFRRRRRPRPRRRGPALA